VFVVAASLAITGCLGGSCYIKSSASTMAGWDGLDPLPKRVNGKAAKVRKTSEPAVSDDASPSEAELAALNRIRKNGGLFAMLLTVPPT
jgi:uncharacterized protein YraI